MIVNNINGPKLVPVVAVVVIVVGVLRQGSRSSSIRRGDTCNSGSRSSCSSSSSSIRSRNRSSVIVIGVLVGRGAGGEVVLVVV